MDHQKLPDEYRDRYRVIDVEDKSVEAVQKELNQWGDCGFGVTYVFSGGNIIMTKTVMSPPPSDPGKDSFVVPGAMGKC